MLREDVKIREYLKRKLAHASVGRVLIERPAKNARVTVYSARPGVVIGKNGEDIEQLRSDLQRIMGVPVHVSIEEIRKPETDAQLIADSIAQQLEKRMMFRRALKRTMQNAMRLGAQGIKVLIAGRLNGVEIALSEWYREGQVPLHSLRADIDYATSEALTSYGIIGIKVWVYMCDKVSEEPCSPLGFHPTPDPREPLTEVDTPVSESNTPPISIQVHVGSLSTQEQAMVVARLPVQLQNKVVTEVMRLELEIPQGLDREKLTHALMEDCPSPIEMVMLSKALLLAEPSSYAVIGIYPSGVVRTVGTVAPGPRGNALFQPFGYWNLLDPDDESQTIDSLLEGISQQLHVVALGLD